MQMLSNQAYNNIAATLEEMIFNQKTKVMTVRLVGINNGNYNEAIHQFINNLVIKNRTSYNLYFSDSPNNDSFKYDSTKGQVYSRAELFKVLRQWQKQIILDCRSGVFTNVNIFLLELADIIVDNIVY